MLSKIFNQRYLKTLIDPFVPGMSEHVLPIRYEALTPDCFLLLFRTTDPQNKNHYFILLVKDHPISREEAVCDIESWHKNEVMQFLPRQDSGQVRPEEDFTCFQTDAQGEKAVLALVAQPTQKGYWADAIKIMPGDKIGTKIAHLSEAAKANTYKALGEILKHSTDPNASFLESLRAKNSNVIVDDVNQTNTAVSIYVQNDDSVEVFYNQIRN